MRRKLLCGMVCLLPWRAGAEVDHRAAVSVVQIRAAPGTGRVFFGSGVVVGPERVATNCHVTRDALKIVASHNGLAYLATGQRADTRRDLCLLTVPGLRLPAARLGQSARLAIGQPLYFYGYPRGLGISFSAAKVRALHPFAGGRVIETTADFTFGGSGGGLFDGGGRLVGLATFLSKRQTQGYAIPADWIATLEKSKAQRVGPLSGLTFWEDVAALPAFLKTPGR